MKFRINILYLLNESEIDKALIDKLAAVNKKIADRVAEKDLIVLQIQKRKIEKAEEKFKASLAARRIVLTND